MKFKKGEKKYYFTTPPPPAKFQSALASGTLPYWSIRTSRELQRSRMHLVGRFLTR